MHDTLILGILYYLTFIPWTFVFLLTAPLGIKLYVLNDTDECKRIQKRISNSCTHTTDNNRGYGYSLGYWYLLHVSITKSDFGDVYTAWIISTEESYKTLTANKNENNSNMIDFDCSAKPKTEITVYERLGSFANPWYKRRVLKIITMEPRPAQDVVIQTIKEHYDVHKHTVVYIHGPPGTGKSAIGILLTNVYKSSYCNNLKLWQPGDNLASLYADVEPSASSPLIIVFDEFDIPLQKIHAGILPHAKLPIQIANKNGWNQLMDEIHIGIYPYIIILLISNRAPDFVRTLDPSYIREGRVDLVFNL